MQSAVLACGAVGLWLVLYGERAGVTSQTVAYAAMTVAAVAGAYLALTVMLIVFARLFRSRRARRLLAFLTFQRAGQIAAGVALLCSVTPQPAAANPVVDGVQAASDAPTLDVLLQRFGFDPAEQPATPDLTVTVAAGDSFWRTAERQVRTVSADASVRQIAEYWLRLVEANLEQLVVAGNLDLLYVGQVLTLPPVTVAGGL